MFENIVEEVPEYKKFLTVDELNASSEQLAQKYPSRVEMFEIGISRKGEKIKALRINKGKKTARCFSAFLIQMSLLAA